MQNCPMLRFSRILRWGTTGCVVAAVWMGVIGADAASRSDRSRTALRAVLTVLRDRQTRADRNPALISHLQALAATLEDPGPERLDRSLIRIAGTTPWGARIVLAGFITISDDPRSTVPEMVGALVDGQIGQRAPATELRRRGVIAYFENWRHGGVHVVLVIPDHVARVAYILSGRAPIYAAVHNNTAAFEVTPAPRSLGEAENTATMKWYAADGKLTKRIPSVLSIAKRA